MKNEENISVIVKIRPLLEFERKRNDKNATRIISQNQLEITNGN